ncbi:hypothetical protein EJ110_NYTH05497 [Nymphaea thermarum]|nr:hypothetical protein EJ110_NYTH05497 [Nymphaea thermarum]
MKREKRKALRLRPVKVSTFLFSLFILSSFFLHSTDGAATYNVLSYGAKANGATDNSAAFLKAWSTVCAQSDAVVTMYVPSGSFLLHPTLFTGPCKSKSTVVQIDGNLVASSDYNLYGAAGYWLKFKNVQGLTFQGGQLDAKGSSLWEWKAQKTNCPDGARSLVCNDAKDIKLKGFTSINSELFNIVIDTSSNVQVDGLNIQSAATSHNTDEIHVEQSSGVTISNTYIKTGDDCISIGQGTQNLWIEKVTCGRISASAPYQGISMANVELTYKGQPAKSSCEHAFGSATGTMVPSSCL